MKKSGFLPLVVIMLLLPLIFAQSPPTIKILSPHAGELILDGAQVHVAFTVQNYESSPEPIHIHFTLDKNPPKMHFNFDPFVLEKLVHGDHILDAQLVNAKHVPLANPEAHAVVRFSVGQKGVEISEKPFSDSQSRTPSSQSQIPDQTSQKSIVESQTSDSRPPTIDHRPQTTDYPPSIPDLKPQTSDQRPQILDSQPQTIDQQSAVPIGQVYQAVTPSVKDSSSAVPVGKAAGFLQQIGGVVKSYFSYVLLLFLAASVIVGGYYGYVKLVQGHFAEIPPSVQYNQQLYNYIRQCTSQGFPKQAIYNKLKGLGFSDTDLTYHFSKVDQELPRAK